MAKKKKEKVDRPKMLNFGASKPRIKGGGRAPGPSWIRLCIPSKFFQRGAYSTSQQTHIHSSGKAGNPQGLPFGKLL